MGLKSTFSFMLDIYDLPRFLSKWKPIDTFIEGEANFVLPVLEEFLPLTVKHQNLPSFVTFVYPFYSIKPRKTKDIGSFSIQATISNRYLSKKYEI